MDESVHPFYYDCPLRLLSITDDMKMDEKGSNEWRERVREFHANKKNQLTVKDFKLNNIVKFSESYSEQVKPELKSEIFTVACVSSKSIIIRDTIGRTYRVKAKNLVKSPLG